MKKNKPTTISNNTFTGVHWDAEALGSVEDIAEGLRINAEGLLAMASLFRSQNIKIETLLKVDE